MVNIMSWRAASTLLACIFAFTAHSASAQSGSLQILNFGNLKGESKVAGHENKIDIFSFNLGVKSPRFTDGGRPIGPPKFEPITILKKADAASAELHLNCALGKRVDTVEIIVLQYPERFLQFGDQPLVQVLKITLSDVAITSISSSTASSGTSTVLVESLVLDYKKIKYEYDTLSENGTKEEHYEFSFVVPEPGAT
jgi:type VI secretion system secreted protein Hcp